MISKKKAYRLLLKNITLCDACFTLWNDGRPTFSAWKARSRPAQLGLSAGHEVSGTGFMCFASLVGKRFRVQLPYVYGAVKVLAQALFRQPFRAATRGVEEMRAC